VEVFLNDQKKSFYKSGKEALKSRWQKCVDIQVDLILKKKPKKNYICLCKAHYILLSPCKLHNCIDAQGQALAKEELTF